MIARPPPVTPTQNVRTKVDLRRKLTWVGLLNGAMVIAALYAGHASATPAARFASTTLAVGRFGEIDVFDQFISRNVGQRAHNGNWLSSQRTKGKADVYVQSNVWQPGGSTGWHTHLSHSLIIVTAGAVTAYEGNDPTCKPTVYTAGMGFVDPGGGHVHILRNEGTVVAQTIAVQVIPAAQARRIDVPDPGNCHF